MITEENLGAAVAGPTAQPLALESSPCCTPEEQVNCCEPSAKAECCAEAAATGKCGCR